MLKMRDILTEAEKLEISKLRLLMLTSDSLKEVNSLQCQIKKILIEARKRFLSEVRTN